jgi:hypothetical protein
MEAESPAPREIARSVQGCKNPPRPSPAGREARSIERTDVLFLHSLARQLSGSLDEQATVRRINGLGE